MGERQNSDSLDLFDIFHTSPLGEQPTGAVEDEAVAEEHALWESEKVPWSVDLPSWQAGQRGGRWTEEEPWVTSAGEEVAPPHEGEHWAPVRRVDAHSHGVWADDSWVRGAE